MQTHSQNQRNLNLESANIARVMETFYPRLCNYLEERYGFKVAERESGPSHISFTGTGVDIDSRIDIESRVHLTMIFFGLGVVLSNIPDEQSRSIRIKDYFALGIPRYDAEGMRYAAQICVELHREDLITWLSEKSEGDRVFTENALSDNPAMTAADLRTLRTKMIVPAPQISPKEIPPQQLRPFGQENIY